MDDLHLRIPILEVGLVPLPCQLCLSESCAPARIPSGYPRTNDRSTTSSTGPPIRVTYKGRDY